jgi:DNA-binding SARP family transcriptional activator
MCGAERTVEPPNALDGSCGVVRMFLFGDFELWVGGRRLSMPFGCQRVLAFLAVNFRSVERRRLAATLWPDTCMQQAMTNVRSRLWHMRQTVPGLVEQQGRLVRLSPDVWIDVAEAVVVARRLLDGELEEGSVEELRLMMGELLIELDDEWVLIERERLRQIRLNALEAACANLTREGSYLRAVEAGLSAVTAEPLRESAHRALISAHLANANAYEALRQYQTCKRLLHEHLGIRPSEVMEKLIAQIEPSGGVRHHAVRRLRT